MVPVSVAIRINSSLALEGLLHVLATDPTLHVTSIITSHSETAGIGSAHDILLVSRHVPDALAVCAEASNSGRCRVIAIDVARDDPWDLDAVMAGCRGIVYDDEPVADVLKAIAAVGHDDIWAPRRLLVDAFHKHSADDEKRRLLSDAVLRKHVSDREREVLEHAAAGLANKEIADRLGITEATVKVHLAHLFHKLGVRGRGELAAAYFDILQSPGHVHFER